MSDLKKIGTVCVDSGQLLLVDPCYLGKKQFKDLYQECCDATYDEKNPKKVFDQVINSLGLCTSTGYGDGEYSVYAEVKSGRVMKIVIDFED